MLSREETSLRFITLIFLSVLGEVDMKRKTICSLFLHIDIVSRVLKLGHYALLTFTFLNNICVGVGVLANTCTRTLMWKSGRT